MSESPSSYAAKGLSGAREGAGARAEPGEARFFAKQKMTPIINYNTIMIPRTNFNFCDILYNMPKPLRTIVICIIAEILNFLTADVFYHTLKIPLFFDTIFTVAVVFYCGLVPGLCVSVGYNLINSLIWVLQKGVADPFIFFYTICGILIVLSTWVVSRRKAEFKISLVVTILYLVLIALISSLCTIISSGILDYFHYIYYDVPDMMNPIKSFTESFVNHHFSLLVSCILAQIPISFADRLIATFAGYGVYRLCERFIERR